MDNLTFIIELLKIFTWPATIMILLLVFRKPLLNIIPNMILKYKDWQISWNAQIEQIASAIPDDSPIDKSEEKNNTDSKEEFPYELSDIESARLNIIHRNLSQLNIENPSAALAAAYFELGNQISIIIENHRLPKRHRTFDDKIEVLINKQIINYKLYQAIFSFRRMLDMGFPSGLDDRERLNKGQEYIDLIIAVLADIFINSKKKLELSYNESTSQK
ncbi:MAG: hypothetical protein P9L92_06725 [Candidatus Electryonea clarkiae]|nr:hypothetical protein [Candidatus Electryonea clarkiae]MDP8286735.1 hypothetical protein [Candidatus Electryonea clarkiae]